jgi:hypothetical protein
MKVSKNILKESQNALEKTFISLAMCLFYKVRTEVKVKMLLYPEIF